MKFSTFLMVLGFLSSSSLVMLVGALGVPTVHYETGICDWVLETTCKRCCVEKGYEAKHSTMKPIANVSPEGGCTCGRGFLKQAKLNSKANWIGKKLAAFHL